MIIFYTVAYLALGLLFVREELLIIEDKAILESDYLVKLGYFIDWLSLLLLYPIVLLIRLSYDSELTFFVKVFSLIFNFAKEIVSFIPKAFLLFAIEIRKLLG